MARERDHAGNPCCGESFMAGTICSLPPNHQGPHSPHCQVCAGDWYNQTCTCFPKCQSCRAYIRDPSAPFCDDCCCYEQNDDGHWCQLVVNHAEDGHECRFEKYVWRPDWRASEPLTEEELAEVYRSLGVSPMQ